MTKELQRDGLKLRRNEKALSEVAADLGFDDLDRLYIGVGDGRLSAKTVVSRLGRRLRPEEEVGEKDLRERFGTTSLPARPTGGPA